MTSSFNNCLLNILKKKEILKSPDLKRVLEQVKITEKKLTTLLIEEGLLSDKDITILVSEETHTPILNLNLVKVDSELIRIVPKKIADRYQLVPIAKIGQLLTVGMVDPMNVFALDDLREITGCTVRAVIVTSKDMQTAFDAYYSESAHIEEFFEMDDLDPDSLQVSRDDETMENETK